jgi:hypothetical protein
MAQIWIIIDNLISIKRLSKIAFLYLNSRLVYANKYQLHFRVNISFILENLLVNLKEDVEDGWDYNPNVNHFCH